MKTLLRSALGLATLGMAVSASAQTLTVDTVAGGPGDTVTVTVQLDSEGASVAGVDLDIVLDADLAGQIESNCGTDFGGVLTNCSVTGQTVNVIFAGGAAVGDGTAATFDVTVDGGVVPPASLAMVISGGLSDNLGGDIDPGSITFVDGAVTVAAGPTLDIAPGAITLSTLANATDSDDFTLTANGGTVGGIDCTATGDAEITFGDAPASLGDGESGTVTATCGGEAGTYSSTLSCASDASNSPAVGTVDCTIDVVPPDPAAPAFDPADGGRVIIGGLVEGGSGSALVTFSETDGDTGYSVSNCAIGAPFSVAPANVNVPAGGSATVTVSVTGAIEGDADTLTCDIVANGATTPYSVDVATAFRPLIVPTLQQWGMILMSLLLAGFGFMTLRRRNDLNI